MPPAHTQPRRQRGELRAQLWRAIRQLGEFSVAGLRQAVPGDMRQSSAYEYLGLLVSLGILREQDGRYTLIRDPGAEPPARLTPRELRLRQLWTALRILRQCGPRELAGVASTDAVAISDDLAADYLAALETVGYVRGWSAGGGRRFALVPVFAERPRPLDVTWLNRSGRRRLMRVYDPHEDRVLYPAPVEERGR